MDFTYSNILAVFFRSNAVELNEGLCWYQQAAAIARRLGNQYLNGDTYLAAAVIAALSPNNRWSRNVADAEALIKVFAAGGSCDAVKVSTFGKNKGKAIAILKGALPLDILGGLKVRAFYQCILGHDAVCVDGHAYSIWLGHRVTTSATPKISEKLYEKISQDYRVAAQQINLITGENYSPAQVQAVTWVVWRNLFSGGLK